MVFHTYSVYDYASNFLLQDVELSDHVAEQLQGRNIMFSVRHSCRLIRSVA